ncbi:glutamine amidotransferase [Pseudogulbenkiania sp. MAI-1]|uniref:glutamine amidotransferase n=1 Tax=Pseudogulbenkiania sp. MAI-1 TaxID=990370 RepID=UPI00045E6E4C|nr:glutamine amidotransferase [Pseudogulbenkiania sp. MAI-1]
MKCLALRHLAFEDLGIFDTVLKQHGYGIEYRQAGIDRMTDDDWLASDLVVVLGGPIGVYERADYPWLDEEIEGVARRLALGLPTLGLCLGAQIMATALGARVYPGKAKEIGWSAVTLTPAGTRSCLSALQGAPVLHWHGDTFDLPAGAEWLASTELTPHQAFASGNHALALQFHPEVDGRRIETWLIGHSGELHQTGLSVAELRAASHRLADEAARAGSEMLNAWLQQLKVAR